MKDLIFTAATALLANQAVPVIVDNLKSKLEVTSRQVKKSSPNCGNGFLIVRTSRENIKSLGCTNYSNENQC